MAGIRGSISARTTIALATHAQARFEPVTLTAQEARGEYPPPAGGEITITDARAPACPVGRQRLPLASDLPGDASTTDILRECVEISCNRAHVRRHSLARPA